ncbi:MAG: cysteine--tRNA ligase [Clostridia bacterium]|nr:cysteine--tRNA ligase [Clostridia bacterium]
MLLYNSLTHKKEVFRPRFGNAVSMYTCGPTVYHFAHIGNLRSYIMEDVLEKALRYEGYDVTRVMNITDVGHLASDADTGEDKMLKGAKRENKTVMEIAQYYTDAFFADCQRLRIKTPDVVEPATGCIPEYIEMIERLLEKGFAYIAGGNVYFDTSKLARYYVFNDHDEEDLAVGVREDVEADDNKRNKADFVLWFTKSKFEDQALKWDSPWGVGYPGWHIECSCISKKHLGEYLDLHCGGIDNAFPHHTNEIAQSEAYLGHEWCSHWFHVHHLNTAGGKMSKSKGEFLTVSLLVEKGYDPLVYRLFCLQSHYRQNLVFTWENLDNAAGTYAKLIGRIAALKPDDAKQPDLEAARRYQEKFLKGLTSDLNTSLAITCLYDVLKGRDIDDVTKLYLLGDFDRVLSLDLLEAAAKVRAASATATAKAAGAGEYAITGPADASEEENAKVTALLTARYEARKAKNWAESDRIRDELAAMGVVVKDSKDGAVWSRA